MNPSRRGQGRRRPGKNTFTTKSGTTITLHRSLGERLKARRDAKARRRAAYLSTLPKNRFKRILYRLHPKRVIRYWFSREGAIMALKITGVGIVVFFILTVGLFAYFRKDLPNITDISGDELGGNITYYDRTGQTVLWQDYDAVKRIPVTGDNISKYIKDATVAIEDKNFYNHGAFDVSAIVRAGINDVFNHEGGVQGGSTITQQLVKLNQNWTNDRTITRKVKELILAVELEREYSKTDILTGYLNIAPYGTIQYGVEAASRDYFGKSAKDLTLAEAAFMAGIPQAPSTYSPYGPYYDPEEIRGRAHYIIDQMVDQGMIKKAEAEEAKKVDVLATIHPLQPKYQGMKAPYFVLAAKNELERKYGDETVQRGGWKVTTTLDLNLQNIAEQQVAKGITQVKRQGGDVAAFAAIDVETAQMVALVGGPDFSNAEYGQVNYAQEKLPPGSSFKPYDYVAMLENTTNAGAGSVLYDTQAPLPGYPCTNKARPKDNGNCLWDYDFRYPGPVTLRYALGGSRNVPAVKAMLTVGVNKTIKTAEALGLKSGYKCYAPGDETLTKEDQCYGSSAIGDGAYLFLDEHVNGFASLSRMGRYLEQTYILKITDAKNKTIDEWQQPKADQVVREDAAYIVTDMLKDPNASYMSRKIHRYKGWEFAVKTGTTNDAKDGLMMGYSTKYAAGVWVGYHNRQKAMTGTMEAMTTPIWQGWMNAAHDGKTPVGWTKPASVKTMPAYVVRSHVGVASVEPSPAQDLFPSWYQPPKSGGSNETIDVVSNKLATSCTPELAKKTGSGGNDNTFSADIFTGAGANNSNASATDDIHNCNDVKPEISLSGPSTCAVGSDCTFVVAVTQGTHALSSDQFPGTVNLLINGQKVLTQPVSSSPSNVTFIYKPESAGEASVEAQVIDSVLYTSSRTTSTSFTP